MFFQTRLYNLSVPNRFSYSDLNRNDDYFYSNDYTVMLNKIEYIDRNKISNFFYD